MQALLSSTAITPDANLIKPRVIHIDDDINMLELFFYNFRKVFEIISLEDWNEVLQKLESENIDAVITDYEMPDVNGLELLDLIKKRNPQMPVIFYTGQGNEEVAREAFIRGATDYFTKELFSFAHKEKLINVIGKAVEMRIEKKRREASEEKFRMLAESAPVAIMIFGNSGCIYANSVSEQITGYTLSETAHKSFIDLLHPDSVATYLQVINNPDSFSDEETKEIEIAIVTKSGNIKWLMVRNKNIIFEKSPSRLTTAIDITYKVKYEQAIVNIIKGLSFRSGTDYFDKVTELLANSLEADFTMIGELEENDKKQIKTLSFFIDGQKADNFTYSLKGTPCENVAGKELCCYPSGVFRLFPNNKMLVDNNIEGYIGYPLFSAEMKPVGIISALFKKPIIHIKFACAVLELFASRTAVDIEREKAEQTLHQERLFMKQCLDATDNIIVVIEKDQKVSFINKKGYETLGYGESEIVGKNWFTCFIPENNRNETEEIFTRIISENRKTNEAPDFHILNKNREEKNVCWSSSLLRNEIGEITAVLFSGTVIE
jgi:PAS domain S-box-containing protein